MGYSHPCQYIFNNCIPGYFFREVVAHANHVYVRVCMCVCVSVCICMCVSMCVCTQSAFTVMHAIDCKST